MSHAIIRRPKGGRRYMYNRPHDSSTTWTDSPFQVNLFDSVEQAQLHLKTNKSAYGPDDEAVEYHSYDGSKCPYCLQGTPRHIGTEHQPTEYVICDMQCTYCNVQWQQTYRYKDFIHTAHITKK